MRDAMTVEQKQCLLHYLGYYKGAVDGIWGQKSQKAQKEFLRDWGSGDVEAKLKHAVTNGMPKAADFWDEIQYFSREEFKCKCGGKYCDGYPAEMQRDVVILADRARKHFGTPGHVISGLRCSRHNTNSGGVSNSQHMYGEAIDLYMEGVSADQLLGFLQQQPELRYAYKINSTNVHFDIPKGAR